MTGPKTGGRSHVLNKPPVSGLTPNPVIQESYDMAGEGAELPMTVSPRGVVYAVLVAGNNAQLIRLTNDKDTAYEWPFKGKSIPAFVGLMKLSNHGSVNVFNILLRLNFEFKGDKTPKEKAAPTIASNYQDWLVEKIAPGDSAQLYFVNETKRVVIVTPAQSVVLEVQDEAKPKNVPLIKREIAVLDQFPITVLGSPFEWKDGRPILPPNFN